MILTKKEYLFMMKYLNKAIEQALEDQLPKYLKDTKCN